MHEGIVRCLLFANDGAETTTVLTALLPAYGVGVTPCAGPRECLILLGREHWHFLALDAGSEPRSALSMLAQSRSVCPEVPVLVIVTQGDTQMAVQAIKAGAVDCVETPLTPARLHSLLGLLDGPGNRASHDLWVRLTPAERIVLRHIMDGRTNRQMAELLSRSVRTIEAHRCRIMEKLNADNLVELVKKTMRAGMIAGPGDNHQRETEHHSVLVRRGDFREYL